MTSAGDGLRIGSPLIGGDLGGENAFLQAAVNEAIANLPPAFRSVAQLRMAGYEVEEIAQRIGRSLRTTERLLQGCRANLESYFDDRQ